LVKTELTNEEDLCVPFPDELGTLNIVPEREKIVNEDVESKDIDDSLEKVTNEEEEENWHQRTAQEEEESLEEVKKTGRKRRLRTIYKEEPNLPTKRPKKSNSKKSSRKNKTQSEIHSSIPTWIQTLDSRLKTSLGDLRVQMSNELFKVGISAENAAFGAIFGLKLNEGDSFSSTSATLLAQSPLADSLDEVSSQLDHFLGVTASSLNVSRLEALLSEGIAERIGVKDDERQRRREELAALKELLPKTDHELKALLIEGELAEASFRTVEGFKQSLLGEEEYQTWKLMSPGEGEKNIS